MFVVGESRDRVVNTALRLFAEYGYSAVSMRDLAGALGIQAPSIYSHFESKDALLGAVVDPFLEAIRDLLNECPAEPVSAGARRAWLTSALTLLEKHPWQLQLVSGDRSLAAHPLLGPQLSQIRTSVIDCLRRLGAADPAWAIGVTGAIVYTRLPRGGHDADSSLGPVDVSTAVHLAEVFLDAR